MSVPTYAARLAAVLALAVAASASAPAEDVYLENGVYVKQLPPWRQRMIQKRMLRQAGVAPVGGSEVVIQGPPAVRVPGPPAARRSMRPLFGPPRFPATVIPQDDPIVITRPSTAADRARRPNVVLEAPAPIVSGPANEADPVELDKLPPVDLPPAREVAPKPGTIISTPNAIPAPATNARPAAPPIELDPEPPLAAPVGSPAVAPASAPVTGPGSGSTAAPRPKRSA